MPIPESGILPLLRLNRKSLKWKAGQEPSVQAAGVFEDMVRVSVGIEDREDLIGDFICAVRESKE